MQKYECIQQISAILEQNKPYVYQTTNGNKTFVLFAADTFRRQGHEVSIDIQPTQFFKTALTVVVHPRKTTIEFTLRRDDDIANLISKIKHAQYTTVSIRACGMTIRSLFGILDWSLHNGWYVDKTFMSTLTQQVDNVNQRNTTLHITIKKG
jgi:hypothetical protein|tara:strand:- start:944 stop:1399 length:456 start_codon:yes stop_codon:yes gene_type:complete